MDADLPVVGWDALGAREAMRRILDLAPDELRRLHTWEERHLRRAHVLQAIRRALARAR